MATVYDKIKKMKGERYARQLRDHNLLNIPNIEKMVKHAGDNAEPILDYLYSLKNITIEEHGVAQDPIKLLRKAGYIAFIADTLEKQNSIISYYDKKEELCTFTDKERFEKCFIIHCVKVGAEKLKRSDFRAPNKFDDYNLSVISIQIAKDGSYFDTIGRYNHAIETPNETYTNLDAIVPGLGFACKDYFGVDYSSKGTKFPDKFYKIDGNLFKINYAGIGENFYIKDNEVIEINKNEEIIIDDFILDLKTKKITDLGEKNTHLIPILEAELEGKSIQIIKNEQGNKCIMANGEKVIELNEGRMVYLRLQELKETPVDFLRNNEYIQELRMDNVTKINDNLLWGNESLCKIEIPKTTHIGDSCLFGNRALQAFFAPSLIEAGMALLHENKYCQSFITPNLETLGYACLGNNGNSHSEIYALIGVEKFVAPKLKKCEGELLSKNTTVKVFDCPLRADDILAAHPDRNEILGITPKTPMAPEILIASLNNNSTNK